MPASSLCVRLSPLGNIDKAKQTRIGGVQIANVAILSRRVPHFWQFRAINALPLGVLRSIQSWYLSTCPGNVGRRTQEWTSCTTPPSN